MLVTLCDVETQDLQAPSMDAFVGRMTDREVKNWRTGEATQSLFFRAANIGDAQVYHRNYLEYLEMAWGSHYAVKLTPDNIWYTLLCELAQVVAADPEKFRGLFSESDEKQEIIVEHGDPVVMPIEALIGMLEKLVPTNTDKFLPEFSTTTGRSRHAFHAAFCDMVSPYYDYSMMLCGIPAIEVLGTKEDWQKVRTCWMAVWEAGIPSNEYFTRVMDVLNGIVSNLDDPNPEFWKDIFRLERCGSGHQTEAFGWFTDLFLKTPDVRFVHAFSGHVSVVKYKQLDTGKNYEMKVGLFTSSVEDGFLVPDYGFVVYEKTDEPVVEKGEEGGKPKFTFTTEEIKAKPRELQTRWNVEVGDFEGDVDVTLVHKQEGITKLEQGFVHAPDIPEFGATTDFDPNMAESEILARYGSLAINEAYYASEVITPDADQKDDADVLEQEKAPPGQEQASTGKPYVIVGTDYSEFIPPRAQHGVDAEAELVELMAADLMTEATKFEPKSFKKVPDPDQEGDAEDD